MDSRKRVIVGMSGGVDSAVAALLLIQQGYEVEGLFMKNWEEDDTSGYCTAAVDAADAEAVCQRLGIRFHTANFATEYWQRVFEHFLQEYQAGRTPNPDILCNKEIKFKAFLAYAYTLGADYIATGHYVRKQQRDNNVLLSRGLDSNKDQSYFLYALNQSQLLPSLFPIGELTKPAVRKLAEEAGFLNHAKKDSTGICFIGERKFSDFLSQYLPAKPGDMVTVEGTIIGQHQGLMYYTLGQRQGLGIGGQKNAAEKPWYVYKKELAQNSLIIGQDRNHPLLFTSALTCNQMSWISGQPPAIPFHCTAKTRYRQADQQCSVMSINDQEFQVIFDTPQWAVTPGQSVVFYNEEICLGGGIIISNSR